MTPLGAARQLAEMDPIMGFYGCFFCQHDRGHGIDCPVPMLPQIVAALEAAAVFVAVNGTDETSMDALMRAEDNLHAAFGDARRYHDGSQN